MEYRFVLNGKCPSKKNSYSISRGHMYQNDEINVWMIAAQWELIPQIRKQQLYNPISATTILTMTLYSDMRNDIDNQLTTIFDLLQKAKIIKNDRLIREAHIYWVASKEFKTEIELKPVGITGG